MGMSSYVLDQQELQEAYRRIATLETALLAAHEYIDGHADVVDGSYGIPQANKAMLLASEIKEVLGGDQ